ncbi:Ero1-like protein [Orchesella cincta]|uniref:Ero1-like protein n=1 Tax=Orchesella cincta TaxID=48709 RepID=A0A1D2N3H9_ORCCI|nr:Ero1-like protein [Orchesella cincta]
MGVSNSLGPFGTDSSEEVCIEKRTFYRAISGLHASINTHLSSKYLLSDTSGSFFKKGKPELEWGPNITEFLNHFERPEARKTGFPWLKNLYFLYLLELRAILKASTFLRNFDLYTGNSEDDTDLKNAVQDLLTVVSNFPSHFDEKALFSTKDSMKLRSEFHERFTNITRIMDCVGCQKCQLWGKLQRLLLYSTRSEDSRKVFISWKISGELLDRVSTACRRRHTLRHNLISLVAEIRGFKLKHV